MPVGLATAVLPGLTTLTVAVNVTAWPYTDGLPDEATVALVLALLTTWVTAVEAGLGMKLRIAAGVGRGDRVAGRAEGARWSSSPGPGR